MEENTQADIAQSGRPVYPCASDDTQAEERAQAALPNLQLLPIESSSDRMTLMELISRSVVFLPAPQRQPRWRVG